MVPSVVLAMAQGAAQFVANRRCRNWLDPEEDWEWRDPALGFRAEIIRNAIPEADGAYPLSPSGMPLPLYT
jgi:hypothetical protein